MLFRGYAVTEEQVQVGFNCGYGNQTMNGFVPVDALAPQSAGHLELAQSSAAVGDVLTRLRPVKSLLGVMLFASRDRWMSANRFVLKSIKTEAY